MAIQSKLAKKIEAVLLKANTIVLHHIKTDHCIKINVLKIGRIGDRPPPAA